jgi:hypothetical protein
MFRVNWAGKIHRPRAFPKTFQNPLHILIAKVGFRQTTPNYNEARIENPDKIGNTIA